MRAHTADALILRTYRYGEADRIVVFLTEDRGKKRGVAKNATKSRRRFGAGLESLTRGRVSYVERETRELVRLDRVEPRVSPLDAAAGYREAAIWVSRADGIVRRVEIVEATGQRRVVALHGLESNTAIAPRELRFTPPAGARVVDQ